MKIQVLFPCLLFLCFLIPLHGQTPQAFSYQAVATDAAGLELSEQAISIRASIVQNTVNGSAQWIEIHQTLTDIFGLFTLQIGTGTPAGGEQSSFSAINWAEGIYFLRIEMDAEGGNNFTLVGTNQLLAVPFALHTDKATSALEADHAIFADTSGFTENAYQAIIADSSSFSTVSQMASFADTSGFTESANHALLADSALIAINADTAQFAQNAENANSAQNAQNAGFAQVAFTAVDDDDKDPENELQTLSITDDSISISNGNALALSELDLFTASGLNLDFPQGTEGYTYTFIADEYTVPSDKVFYVIAAEDTIKLPGVGSNDGSIKTMPNLPVFPQGAQLAKCKCLGFLADMSSEILPLISILQANGGNFFQVPPDMQLVIKSGIDTATDISLNQIVVNYANAKAIVIPEGIQLRNESAEEIIITGYLKTIE